MPDIQVVKKIYLAQTLVAARCKDDPELETAEDLLSRALYELLGQENFRSLMSGIVTSSLMDLSLEDTLQLMENMTLLCQDEAN